MPGVIRIGRDYRDEGAAPRPGWHGKRAWWPVVWPELPVRVTVVLSWWLIKGLVWDTTGVFSAQGGGMLCQSAVQLAQPCQVLTFHQDELENQAQEATLVAAELE
ncbi:hypothetical protein E3N88_25880 [Mikania micrantha]|uniref:Uncharacterized protein n=1 Tax=Mikania micrantha TaxID=192012 RepID=A0A5N6N8R2_9ASTR|nr:hypothetical protein E3N88_25880 [Mikania micrantha]